MIKKEGKIEKSCRYCKHYCFGYCENENVLQYLQVNNNIYEISESGKLAEVLQEAGLPWNPIDDEEKFVELDEKISRLYEELELTPALKITRDDEFFCSEWK